MASDALFRVKGSDCHNFEFNWTINNFSSDARGELLSPLLSLVPNCNIEWKITVDFTPDSPASRRGSMKVGLLRTDSLPVVVNTLCMLELCDYQEVIYKKDSLELWFAPMEIHYLTFEMVHTLDGDHCDGLLSSDFILVHDCLKLRGNIIVKECCQKKKDMAIKPDENILQLQCDFKSFLRNQQFTDIALNIGNDVIHSHKFVLCARSPAFKKMFEQNTGEVNQSSINITDIEKSVLENFLTFLYTGVIENCEFNSVIALYSVAHKSEVRSLQRTCSAILTSYISANTVCKILKLAEVHNDNILKEIAVRFICNSFPKVEATDEWRILLESDPCLASYTMRRVATSISKC